MPNPLRSVSAKGFRSLADVKVQFGDFSVLIGPNGSGKTNLLRVLSFVRDTARFDVRQAIELAGGFNRVLRQDGKASQVELGITARVTDNSSLQAADSYMLTLESLQAGLSRKEQLQYKRLPGRGRRLTIKAQGREVDVQGNQKRSTLQLSSDDVSALGMLAKIDNEDLGPGPHQFFDFLSRIRYLDPQVHEARQSSRLASTQLNDQASNLSAALYTIRSDDPDAFEAVKRDVRLCLPGLEEIEFESIGGAATSVVVRIKERGLTKTTELADASFGTVRALALIVALVERNPPPLTVIEEVDHGLHPYALDVLVDRMREASERTQIIVASHSPTLVNRLKPEEIIVCGRDAETGESIIPATSQAQIASALEDGTWKAGELWFSGLLGGVPL